jgi:hypothetical protein
VENAFQKVGDDAPPKPGAGGALQYWSAIDPVVGDVLSLMDERDYWSIEDEAAIRTLLDRVIARMKSSPVVSGYCLAHPDKAIGLMAWMKSSSAMMLLHYADEDRKQVINQFLSACASILQTQPDNDELYRSATLALERFLVFEKLAVFSRLFSPERAQALESALQTAISLAKIPSSNKE